MDEDTARARHMNLPLYLLLVLVLLQTIMPVVYITTILPSLFLPDKYYGTRQGPGLQYSPRTPVAHHRNSHTVLLNPPKLLVQPAVWLHSYVRGGGGVGEDDACSREVRMVNVDPQTYSLSTTGIND